MKYRLAYFCKKDCSKPDYYQQTAHIIAGTNRKNKQAKQQSNQPQSSLLAKQRNRRPQQLPRSL